MDEVRQRPLAALIAAFFLAPAGALAQQAEQQLPEVRVRAPEIRESAYGPVEGYRAERTGTATKTDTPIREVPAGIQVVPKQVIQDQQATRIADVIENVSSARPGSTFGNRATLGLKNVFDKEYIESPVSRTEVYPGAPRTVFATLEVKL